MTDPVPRKYSSSGKRVRRPRPLAPITLLISSMIVVLAAVGFATNTGHSEAIRLVRVVPHQTARRSNTGSTRPIALTVEAIRPGQRFTAGAVGLSIETASLITGYISPTHRSLVGLLRSLGPGILRVGGNTLDDSWWTSDSEPSPPWATNTITPTDLERLHELLTATNWRAIVGVNFGHFEPARAANEASWAAHILGARLLAIEIGNEPNGYGLPSVAHRDSTYNVTTYLSEISIYDKTIHAISPNVPLYGPELSAPSNWLAPIASDAQRPFAELTEHYYPTSYNVASPTCLGTPVPTALDLFSPHVFQQENEMIEELVAAGQQAHVPTRISETNTTSSCDASGGPDTGPVFASALWSLDWALRSASAGVSGINFHTTFGSCTPNAFTPLCASNQVPGQVIARPEYYGLLAARQLEGGRFVPVDLPEHNVPVDFTAYATVHRHGTITVAIDNFATNGRTAIALVLPNYNKAVSEILNAPSINARGDVTLGRQPVDAAGELRPTRTSLPHSHGQFRLELAPASAAIITLEK
jgi:hypothetical protein